MVYGVTVIYVQQQQVKKLYSVFKAHPWCSVLEKGQKTNRVEYLLLIIRRRSFLLTFPMILKSFCIKFSLKILLIYVC